MADDRVHDPFGRAVRLPGDFTREGRIALLAKAFDDLLAGRLPSLEACLYLGAAGSAWLREGGTVGSLERDYLKVSAPHRSTLTAGRMWQRMQQADASTARATDDDEPDTMGAIDDDEPPPS